MDKTLDAYTARPSGPAFEILDPEGTIIAWAVASPTAQAIVALLNLAHVSGLLDLNHDTTD